MNRIVMNKLLYLMLLSFLFPYTAYASKQEKNIKFFSVEGSEFGTPINKLQQEELLKTFYKDIDLSMLPVYLVPFVMIVVDLRSHTIFPIPSALRFSNSSI